MKIIVGSLLTATCILIGGCGKQPDNGGENRFTDVKRSVHTDGTMADAPVTGAVAQQPTQTQKQTFKIHGFQIGMAIDEAREVAGRLAAEVWPKPVFEDRYVAGGHVVSVYDVEPAGRYLVITLWFDNEARLTQVGFNPYVNVAGTYGVDRDVRQHLKENIEEFRDAFCKKYDVPPMQLTTEVFSRGLLGSETNSIWVYNDPDSALEVRLTKGKAAVLRKADFRGLDPLSRTCGVK